MTVPVLPVLWVWGSALAAIGLGLGWWATHWSLGRVSRDGPLTRLRRWERGGDVWLALGILRWKDHLPEAGALFGGEAKGRVRSHRTEDLARFAAETRRAERVHWMHAATGPLLLLVAPLPVAAVLIVLTAAFNAPFIMIQRFNRGRVLRILDRRRRRSLAEAPT